MGLLAAGAILTALAGASGAVATPAGVPACRVGDLRAHLTVQGATGSIVGGIVVTNRSRRACSLPRRLNLRFVGAGRIRYDVLYTRSLPYSGRTLVTVLRRGRRATAAIHWSNWCAPGSRPASGPGPLPRALVLTLSRSRGSLWFRVPRAPRCDVPKQPSVLVVARFARG